MSHIFINFIGPDGSGKTTLSSALKLSLDGCNRTIWCGAESFLLYPIRKAVNTFTRLYSKSRKDFDYIEDIHAKKNLLSRSNTLRKLYIALVLLDYRIQYLWKMLPAKNYQHTILDRYFFDVAVNLAIRIGWTNEELIDFIRIHMHKFRMPDLRVWVNVSPETSMSRKDDIPDIEYIKQRINYYEAIANAFNFIKVDGTDEIQINVDRIKKRLTQLHSNKKILYVHSNNEDIGGADKCLYRLATDMQEKGHNVGVVLRLKTDIFSDYSTSGVPVYHNKFERPQLSRGFGSKALIPLYISRDLVSFIVWFKRQSPDIIHVNDLYDIVPSLAAKILGIPVYYHIRMFRQNRLQKFIFTKLIDFVAHTSISVSEAIKLHYFPSDKNWRRSHRVIHDWPDERLTLTKSSLKRPVDYEPKSISVIMIGRLEKWTGQDIFLDAVQILNEKKPINVEYFVVGGIVKGTKKEAFGDGIIQRCNQIENVTYLGERNDIPNLLVHSQISVHASTEPDPFPGVVLESLLANCTVIAANSGGVKEMIPLEKHNMLFQPGDPNDLAKKLKDAIESYKEADSFSNRIHINKVGRDWILKLTDKELISSKINAAYAESTS